MLPQMIRDWIRGRRNGQSPYKSPPETSASRGVRMIGHILVGMWSSKGVGVRWEMNEWKGPAVKPLHDV